MRTISLFFVALALTVQSAQARDPYADVAAMRIAFAHVRSVVAVERFSSGQLATIEYTSPNRYHITMPGSQIALAGNREYTKPAGGTWKRAPDGASTGPCLMRLGNWPVRRTAMSASSSQLPRCRRAYNEILWIGANELPVQARLEMPDQSVTIHYIAYNASVLTARP